MGAEKNAFKRKLVIASTGRENVIFGKKESDIKCLLIFDVVVISMKDDVFCQSD